MTRNVEITIVGAVGWFLSNAPGWFENITGMIAVTSSAMGIMMLFISIRTGIVNYRLKRFEYEKKKKEHQDWIINEKIHRKDE